MPSVKNDATGLIHSSIALIQHNRHNWEEIAHTKYAQISKCFANTCQFPEDEPV